MLWGKDWIKCDSLELISQQVNSVMVWPWPNPGPSQGYLWRLGCSAAAKNGVNAWDGSGSGAGLPFP